MHINLDDKNITEEESCEIENLLQRQDESLSTDLEQMWYLMDLIWDDFNCDNKDLNWINIGGFYSHPVWLLNGFFQEQDDVSMGHRHAISDWVVNNKFDKVVDYGGGFGTLARLIAQKNVGTSVYVYEPHPSEYGLKRATEHDNIFIIEKLGNNYDCLLSTDVLEHVEDPLKDFSNMISSVKIDGYLVIANAFYPMIKCHLPHNYHFRYSFNFFAKIMGLENVRLLEGSHATIFRKLDERKTNWVKIHGYENISKIIFPAIEIMRVILRPIKKFIFG